jgi:hypothetical protein
MIVIVEEEVRQIGGALVTGAIRASIGPFASESLDEALGLAVGLGAIRLGEEMRQAEGAAGAGEVLGAIRRPPIGEQRADLNAVSAIELECLVEGLEDAGDAFIGKQTSESQARMIIDGDMEELEAGAGIADGAIAGGAYPGAAEAAELLDVEME